MRCIYGDYIKYLKYWFELHIYSLPKVFSAPLTLTLSPRWGERG